MKYICSQCCEEKEKEDFHKAKTKRGFIYSCKECESARYKRKKAKDPEAHNLKSKLWARGRAQREPDYHLEYYKKNKDRIIAYQKIIRERHAKKINARSRLGIYIAKGYIEKPQSCSKCYKNNVKIEGHHEDYSDFKSVIWVCRECHVILDKEKRDREILEKYNFMKSTM